MVIAAATVMIMGVGLPVVSNAMTLNTSSAAAASATAAAASAASAATSAAVSPAVAKQGSPHPGTLDVYEVVPGGATTEDPAIAYDVTSGEVLFNTYETLVSYNGSSTATFVPTLATCVPGQGDQCNADYGVGSYANFTGIYNTTGAAYTGANGEPKYWTFVIDPAAQFYDPSTKGHFAVYPTDVMFSVARTLAWADFPKDPGWIIAQSLLPLGNSSWDNGAHAPYNNTPENIYNSMLINDSAFCPAKAMGALGHGCITFVAYGLNQAWPEFLDFVEDNSGASVVPCGWYQYEGAYPGVSTKAFPEPASVGWGPSAADMTAKGDDSCLLPNGANNSSAMGTWMASHITSTSWDKYEASVIAGWPAPETSIQWSIVASGPYYTKITPHISYALGANPYYAQPSGCGGNPTSYAQITGNPYCDPSVNGYIHNATVIWETTKEGDSLGTSAVTAGTADFAGFTVEDTGLMLSDVESGLWQYFTAPSLSTGFIPINFFADDANYNSSGLAPLTSAGSNILPEGMYTNMSMRNFLANSFPYTAYQETFNTVGPIEFDFLAGGPIPVGMGNYYPNNVSWPYLFGNPTQANTVANSAAWWWNQIVNNTGGPWYNAYVASSCTSGSPCTLPIGYFDGEPQFASEINTWASYVSTITQNRFVIWPDSMTFDQFLGALVAPYESWMVADIGFGWSPDYPDPTDYIAPMAAPDGDYTAADAVAEQLSNPLYENNVTCGHNETAPFATLMDNLGYWAAEANISALGTSSALSESCQGVAYKVASVAMAVAGATSGSPQRVLEYNLVEQIVNALALDIYTGQVNYVFGSAPWISEASINSNPVVGAGEINDWFQVRYVSGVEKVSVSESGLPAGTTWHFAVGGKTLSNTTVAVGKSAKGAIDFYESAGTYPISAAQYYGPAPAPSNGNSTNDTLIGYSAYAVSGPAGTTWSSATVTAGASLALTLKFGQNTTVNFIEGAVKTGWSGLPGGSIWNVTLTPHTPGSDEANVVVLTNTTSGATGKITFSAPVGLAYSYTVGSPTNYKSSPPKGSLTVSTKSSANNHTVYFDLVTATITFVEHGLTAGTKWGVNVTGPESFSLNATSSSIKFVLESGTYTVTYWAVSGYTGPTGPTSITVNAPKGASEVVTYTKG